MVEKVIDKTKLQSEILSHCMNIGITVIKNSPKTYSKIADDLEKIAIIFNRYLSERGE